MSGTRTAAAAAAAMAGMLLVTACSESTPAATVTDEDSVLDAVATSFAGSWSWSGQLDVALSDGQVDAIVDLGAGGEFGAPPDAVERQVRLALDEFSRQQMHGALGDDQSFRSAWRRDDADLVDIRLDAGEVLRAESMTPEASLVGAVDVPAIATFVRDMAEVDGAMMAAGMLDVEQLKAQARQFIEDQSLLRVVIAILDGGFGGVVGQLDFADMDVTEDELDDVRQGLAEELIGLADAETFRELASEAVTVRAITSEAGVTRAVVDLHPRAAADAVYDLFDDAEMMAEDLADSYVVDEDMPETIEEVAQLTFDAQGNLTEVRTDVLGVAGQLASSMDVDPEAARMLTALRGATVHVVFGFGDHDAVDTVMDVDATTMPWDEIMGFFRQDIDDALDR